MADQTPFDFDDIIIGGGSAGCVLANRLSADPARRVLLVEAGVDTPPGAVPPEIDDTYPMPIFHRDRYIWPNLKVTVSRLADGAPVVRTYEQGRVMGGSSSINSQAANRGLPRDYDHWASIGAAGWDWDGVLPFFRALESDLDCDGPLHGHDGPIAIRRPARETWPPFAHAVAAAFGQTGLPFHVDQNGEFGDGLFLPAISNRDDRRVSAAAGYLTSAVRARANLKIRPQTRLVRIIMAGNRADAIVLRGADGSQATLRSRRLLLTAGALQSPAILMRAGIGPGDHLRGLGIGVAIDRPGVGQNLRDHPRVTLCQYIPPRLRLFMQRRRVGFLVMRYSSGLDGGSASDMYVTSANRAAWHKLGERLAAYVIWCNQPHSVGSLRLASPDPDAFAQIDLNLLGDERDLLRLAAGVRRIAGLIVCDAINRHPGDVFPADFSPAIKRLSAAKDFNRRITAVLGQMLDVPGPLRRYVLRNLFMRGVNLADLLQDEAQLHDFIRDRVSGVWHPTGTCRMGNPADPAAVVDPAGKVIGSANIWVCDASVMPRLPTANTNIPTIMIAEKIAASLATGT